MGAVTATWRIVLVGAVLAGMLGVLGLRLWTLQITGVEEYQARAESNQIRLVNTPAPRGDVFDRNGILLAGTRPSLAVVVDMALVTDETVGRLASNLAAFLDEPEEDLLETFEGANSGAQLILAADLSEERALLLLEHREDFPGVAVIPQPVREYPGGDLAAHVLGYIGRPSEEDLERPDVKGNDVVGKAGVERVYDRELRGTEGIVKYQVDADRTVLSKAGEQTPRPGSNLFLTIDAATQAQLQASLQEGLELARRLEMEERVDALELQNVETRMALAREEATTTIREAAIRAAEIAEEDEGAASEAPLQDELADLPSPDELEEGEVLGVALRRASARCQRCVRPGATARPRVGGANRAQRDRGADRSGWSTSPRAGSADRVAVVVVDGERFTLQEGDRFATTLRVTDIEIRSVGTDPFGQVLPGAFGGRRAGSDRRLGDRDGVLPDLRPRPPSSAASPQRNGCGSARRTRSPTLRCRACSPRRRPSRSWPTCWRWREGIYPLDRPIEDRVLGSEQPEEDVEFGTDQPPGGDTAAADLRYRPLPLHGEPAFRVQRRFLPGVSRLEARRPRPTRSPRRPRGVLRSVLLGDRVARLERARRRPRGSTTRNLWQEWARAFGFGEASGVDLPFEKQGLIPDRTWFRDEQRAGTGRVRATGPWVGGDLMNAVVGQGTVLVTPLQLANGFSAMVNGGTVWQPRVVDRITNQSGTVIDPRDPGRPATGRPRFRNGDRLPQRPPDGRQRVQGNGAAGLRELRRRCLTGRWQDGHGGDHQI